jgi:KTSC domain-containing protein
VFCLFEARSYRRSLGGEEMIHRKKLKDSSLIRSAGWSNAVISIQYTDGTIFNYGPGVPESVYQKLLSEDSAGAYWLSVRDKYDFKEVKK